MFAWDAKIYTSIIEVLADRKNRGALFFENVAIKKSVNVVINAIFCCCRRRSRAVLYGIQDHYKANPRKSKLKKYQNKVATNVI